MTEPARTDPNDQWRFDMTLPPARIRRTRWSRSFAAIIKSRVRGDATFGESS